MKTPILFLLSLTLSSILLCEAAGSSSIPIRDLNGNTVLSGVKYHVVPVHTSQVGGLDLASTGNQTCPLSVVQLGPKNLGSAVEFYPIDSNNTVFNGTDLNVEFVGVTTKCPDVSNVWRITGFDPENVDQKHYIINGGEKGNPSYANSIYYFMILKTKNGYKFKFCPVAMCDCNPVCQDIGISVEKKQRLLLVGADIPLEVNFKRA